MAVSRAHDQTSADASVSPPLEEPGGAPKRPSPSAGVLTAVVLAQGQYDAIAPVLDSLHWVDEILVLNPEGSELYGLAQWKPKSVAAPMPQLLTIPPIVEPNLQWTWDPYFWLAQALGKATSRWVMVLPPGAQVGDDLRQEIQGLLSAQPTHPNLSPMGFRIVAESVGERSQGEVNPTQVSLRGGRFGGLKLPVFLFTNRAEAHQWILSPRGQESVPLSLPSLKSKLRWVVPIAGPVRWEGLQCQARALATETLRKGCPPRWQLVARMLLCPKKYFVWRYIFQGGFRDGLLGLQLAIEEAVAQFMAYALLLEWTTHQRSTASGITP